MPATLQYASHIVTCRTPTSGSALDQRRVVSLSRTFQRVLRAALCGTDGGSCYFHCTVLAALCACLCLFLLLNVVYLAICAKLWLIVGMTKQMSDGKEADIVNR